MRFRAYGTCFGSKNHGRKTNQLFFTAGLNATTFYGNGLFGSISTVGESAPDGDLVNEASGQVTATYTED